MAIPEGCHREKVPMKGASTWIPVFGDFDGDFFTPGIDTSAFFGIL